MKGKHHIIDRVVIYIISAIADRYIISRLWRRHHFGLFCGGTITMRTDALRQIENHIYLCYNKQREIDKSGFAEVNIYA